MKSLTIFITLFAITLLSGCKLRVPAFDSASIEVHAGGRLTAQGVLADSQIRGLREWLAERKTGWEHRIESTAPAVIVKLEHRGRVVGVMNVMPHQVKVGDYFRPITPAEADRLRLLLTTFLSSKK